jgi:putative flippase GtrA
MRILTVLSSPPAWLTRLLSPAGLALLGQFSRFGMVGVIGLGVDTAVVYGLRALVGLYVAGAVSYVVAVTATWWVNRVWTFRAASRGGSAHQQWARFALANLPGLVLNRSTYFALVTFSAFCVAYPVLAVAAGAVAGMFANFTLSRALVFR